MRCFGKKGNLRLISGVKGSVPCRGKRVVAVLVLYSKEVKALFPSPTGEVGVVRNIFARLHARATFPSPTGEGGVVTPPFWILHTTASRRYFSSGKRNVPTKQPVVRHFGKNIGYKAMKSNSSSEKKKNSELANKYNHFGSVITSSSNIKSSSSPTKRNKIKLSAPDLPVFQKTIQPQKKQFVKEQEAQQMTDIHSKKGIPKITQKSHQTVP